jgi:thiosulfate reductase cytochrome b subunit
MSAQDNRWVAVHPLVVRITHWVNVVAVLIMLTSGWQIYNASPVFEAFSFPYALTLGGWLAGALQWHFAAMWLFAINGLVYVLYGIASGHFRRKLLPISPRAPYLVLIGALIVLVLSGLVIWKPVQLYWLGILMGDYEGARVLHFFAMAAVVLIVIVHVLMVVLVPRTFPTMFTGRARRAS